jgi:hypothetical protein
MIWDRSMKNIGQEGGRILGRGMREYWAGGWENIGQEFGRILGRSVGAKLGNSSDEAMKRFDEALNASSLQFLPAINASLLHCFNFLP